MLKTKTSINIDEKLWKAFKHHCIDIGKDISWRLEELVKKEMLSKKN